MYTVETMHKDTDTFYAQGEFSTKMQAYTRAGNLLRDAIRQGYKLVDTKPLDVLDTAKGTVYLLAKKSSFLGCHTVELFVHEKPAYYNEVSE